MSFGPITPPAGGGGGGDLLAANNLGDVASAATSRVNLDLYAREYHVAPADAPYTTVQSAIDAAETAVVPSVVIVHPGTYNEDTTVSADTVALVGYGNQSVIVGEMAIDVGDGVADAASSHVCLIQGVRLEAGAGDTTVLAVSGNPQTLRMRNVEIDGGTGTVDGVNLGATDGAYDFANVTITTPSGGTGTPLTVDAGTLTCGANVLVDYEDGDDLAIVTGASGAITSSVPIRVSGGVSNQGNGNGSFSIYAYLDVETNNTEAIDCQGAGLYYIRGGSLADASGSNPNMASGGGSLYLQNVDLAVSGYSNTDAPDANAFSGYIELDPLRTWREVDTGGTDGQVLTNDGAGSYGWEDVPTPEADEVTYTPTDAGDWDPDPSTVEAALDDLADRVQLLEAAGGVSGAAYLRCSGNTTPLAVNTAVNFDTLTQTPGFGVTLASRTVTVPSGAYYMVLVSLGARTTSSAGYIDMHVVDVTGVATNVSGRVQWYRPSATFGSGLPPVGYALVDASAADVDLEFRVTALSSGDYIDQDTTMMITRVA